MGLKKRAKPVDDGLIEFEYSHSNSGGGWWLTDEDWKALEEAGWNVEWYRARWLGALATNATVRRRSAKEAISEFESLTNQNFFDLGCTCCGPPHTLRWEGGYLSGSDSIDTDYRPW